MTKMLRSQKLQELSSLIIKLCLMFILLVAALIPAKSQLQNHAVGLYSGPKVVSKQITANSIKKPTISQNLSALPSTTTVGTWTALTSAAHYGNSGVCL